MSKYIKKMENLPVFVKGIDPYITLQRVRDLAEEADKEVSKLDSDLGEEIDRRDHWENKATELANDIGNALGFDVGEHSNMNCPVQTAIDLLDEIKHLIIIRNQS